MASQPKQHGTGTVTPLKDFPLAERDRHWDGDVAEKAIRDATGAGDVPTAAYADCFFWHDADAPDRYGSYKLLYCDVIAGEIVAVPHAIFAVAGILDGARGGTSIPRSDQDQIKTVVGRWYTRMADAFHDASLIAPWATREPRS